LGKGPLTERILLKNSYRFLEHTADMGLEATGATLEELFANAADGLREMIFGAHPTPLEQTSLDINLEGMDIEELLVSWLNEILYVFETQQFVPFSFQVKKVASTHMSASMFGRVFEKNGFSVQREVKAVTYHQLTLEKTESGWLTRLFVDL
jgi:SHS2 domain-containing protein